MLLASGQNMATSLHVRLQLMIEAKKDIVEIIKTTLYSIESIGVYH